MRLIFISIGLLYLWILPNQISAHTKVIQPTNQSETGSQITNKLIALFKKCQNLNRKISPKSVSTQKIARQKSTPKFISKKPKLSIISSREKSLRKAEVHINNKSNLPSNKKSAKKKHGSWSFLRLFSQLRGPAPFARR